jgi:hypothetical protein
MTPAAGAPTASRGAGSQYIKVANETAALTADGAAGTQVAPIELTNETPVQTINFDGTSPRASVDFTPTSGTVLAARWTPDAAGQPLNVREINAFGDLALNDYELAPDTVAEGPQGANDGGKTVLPSESGKESLPPAVGEQDPLKTAFIPGVPVFPPNIPVSP